MVTVTFATVTAMCLVVGGFVAFLALRSGRPLVGSLPKSADDWLVGAREIAQEGRELGDRIEGSGRSNSGDVAGTSAGFVDEIKRYNAAVAAISATAPTAMDGRVCRQVGVEAHALSGALQRQVRIHHTADVEDPVVGRVTAERADALRNFRLAILDLEHHVDLL